MVAFSDGEPVSTSPENAFDLVRRNNNKGRYDDRITLQSSITTSMRRISQDILGSDKDFVVRCKQVVLLVAFASSERSLISDGAGVALA
jgi:hypothetical protein